MTTPKIGPSDKAGLSDLPSSAQRTPGPWALAWTNTECGDDLTARIEKDGKPLATLVMHAQGTARTDVAKMVAADAMYEALRLIANSYGPASDLENVLMFRDIARAALARIEK